MSSTTSSSSSSSARATTKKAPPAATAPRRRRPAEKIVAFAPAQLKAPFLLRCGALAIDYIILVAAPVVGILLGRYMGNDGVKLLNGNNTGWLIAVLLGVTNFVIFPLLSGQSVGKMLTGQRILQTDGRPATIGRILIRHLLGYPLTVASLGLGFLLTAFDRKGRALHDFLAGTMVIYGRRRVLRRESK